MFRLIGASVMGGAVLVGSGFVYNMMNPQVSNHPDSPAAHMRSMISSIKSDVTQADLGSILGPASAKALGEEGASGLAGLEKLDLTSLESMDGESLLNTLKGEGDPSASSSPKQSRPSSSRRSNVHAVSGKSNTSKQARRAGRKHVMIVSNPKPAPIARTGNAKTGQMNVQAMGQGVVASVVVAGLVCAMMQGFGIRKFVYGKRVAFVLLMGVVVSLAMQLPGDGWSSFSLTRSLPMAGEVVSSWFLAGIVMAFVLGRKRADKGKKSKKPKAAVT